MNDTVAVALELAAACVRARYAETAVQQRDARIVELEARVAELEVKAAETPPEPLRAVPPQEEKENG